jgi:hypothetical protein
MARAALMVVVFLAWTAVVATAADPEPQLPKLDPEDLQTEPAAPGGIDARGLPPTVAVCQDGKRCWVAKTVEECRPPLRLYRLVIDDAGKREADVALEACEATLKEHGVTAPPRPD